MSKITGKPGLVLNSRHAVHQLDMIIMDSFSNETDQTGQPIKTERSSNHPDTPEIVEGPIPPNANGVLING